MTYKGKTETFSRKCSFDYVVNNFMKKITIFKETSTSESSLAVIYFYTSFLYQSSTINI